MKHFIRNLDPPITLACAILLCAVIATLQSLQGCLLAFAAATFLLTAALGNIQRPGKKILAANAFICLIWLTVPWLTPGEAVWQWKSFVITQQGLTLATAVTLKANAIVFIFFALILPMPRYDLANALLFWRVPDRLVLLLLLVERNVEILKSQWRSLTEAAKLRCFRAGMNLRSYQLTAAKLALLLLRAGDRADRLHEAILLRGFDGNLHMSAIFKPGYRDFLFSCAALVFCMALLGVEHGLFNG